MYDTDLYEHGGIDAPLNQQLAAIIVMHCRYVVHTIQYTYFPSLEINKHHVTSLVTAWSRVCGLFADTITSPTINVIIFTQSLGQFI